MKKIILTLFSILLTFNMLAQVNTFKNNNDKEFSVKGKKLSKLISKWETTLYFYEKTDKNLIISQVVLDTKETELQRIIITSFPLNKIRKEKNSPEFVKEKNEAFIPEDVCKIIFLSNETNVAHFTQTNVELYDEKKKAKKEKVTFEFVYFPNEKDAKAFLEEFNKAATTTPKTGIKTNK